MEWRSGYYLPLPYEKLRLITNNLCYLMVASTTNSNLTQRVCLPKSTYSQRSMLSPISSISLYPSPNSGLVPKQTGGAIDGPVYRQGPGVPLLSSYRLIVAWASLICFPEEVAKMIALSWNSIDTKPPLLGTSFPGPQSTNRIEDAWRSISR